MSHLPPNTVTGSRFWNQWMRVGLLAFALTALSTSASGTGSVLFEDHFYNESSLANWGQSYEDNGVVYWSPAQGVSLFLRDGGMSMEGVCPDQFCAVFDDTLALLNRDYQWRNFELTVKLKSYTYEWDVPESRIVLRTLRFAWLDADDAAYSLHRGKGYAVQLTASTPAPEEAIPFPLPFNHVNLIRQDCPSTITCSQQTVATASFSPLYLPIDVRVIMNEGTIQVFLNGKESIAYTDPNPIPAGGIGLGDNGAFVAFDDIVIKDRHNLRCSADARLNGKDPVCSGGLYKKPMWVHLWPPDDIKRVDFYLDGKFLRTERFPPWELDGGKSTGLSAGPHEVRAEIDYQDGRKATVRSSFDVGERPLRCSADAILDGNDPSCDGLNFDKPMWVYWWPEAGVKSVDFSLNRVLHRIERIAPYELDGGVASYPQPIWNNSDFGNYGTNEIRAVAHFKDGRKALTQDASVGVPRGLRCSPDHILDGNDPVCYEGTFTEPLWVYWWPEAGVKSIDFFLNGEFYRTERKAPYELDAGAAFDARGAHDECYYYDGLFSCSYSAVVQFKDGSAPVTEERSFLVYE